MADYLVVVGHLPLGSFASYYAHVHPVYKNILKDFKFHPYLF